MANRINVKRFGTYWRTGICSNHSGMVISTTNYILLRWSLSWALRPSNSWNAAIDVVSIGTPKVSTSLSIHFHREPDYGVQGNWIAATPILEQTLETREMRLAGDDRDLLLALVRKILRWLPEERPSAEELYEDEFILQFMKKAK